MSASYPPEIIDAAKMMFLRQLPVKQIAEALGVTARVVYQWIKKHSWGDMLQHETVEQVTARRLIALVETPNKTDAIYKEIEKCGNLLDKLAGIDLKKAKIAQQAAKAARGDKREKKAKKGKNEVGEITAEQLEKIRLELFYQYQQNWHNKKDQRTRFILKSRQIGATFYFAWEAFEDAILSGDNQIFLSASRAQAEIFKTYIIKFALEYFEIELKGAETIELFKDGKPWAEFRFVSTNGRTAQGYHGHLYVDEVFWIPDFAKLNKLASGMAAHKKWRKTYFSTPSVKSHGAYPMWSGDKYNANRKAPVEFDLSRDTMLNGHKGVDNIWRCVVSVVDAQAQGCDLFDIDELKDEYSKAEFNNLFMCAFMEADASVFNFDDLLACAVDAAEDWPDFKPRAAQPFARRPVWVGYDPARFGDRSSVVIVAPPLGTDSKFRLLEKLELKGNFAYQAGQIKKITERYNVAFLGIDSTGPGLGVYEQVQAFCRYATPIHYTLESKTRLVLKAIDIIEGGRIEWDAEHTDVPQAFLQVQQVATGKDQITYVANRDAKTGHADVAWSIMHALSNEPLVQRRRSAMAFSD